MLMQSKPSDHTSAKESLQEVTVDKESENSTDQQKEDEPTSTARMETETYKIGELTPTNWKSWSIKFQAYMQLQDLWSIVDEALPADTARDADWKKKDQKALNMIILKMSDKLIGVVSKSTHARDAFQSLKQHFEGSGNTKMALLFDRLFNLKVNPPETIAEFATEFASVTDEI